VTWDHPPNEKATRRETKSPGGFTFKTSGRPFFIAMPERLGLHGKFTGRQNYVRVKGKIDPFCADV
jgi:hypothetical protein